MKEGYHLMDQAVYRITMSDAVAQETLLQLWIRPKPYWMPSFVWYWLISKMLIISKDRM